MTKHYEFVLEDTIEINGHKLTRIRALVDLPQHEVKAGDHGGYIECERNLLDEAWVFGNACIYGSAVVSGNAIVWGEARVYDSAVITNNAMVGANAAVFGKSRVYNNAQITHAVKVFDNTIIGDNAILLHNVIVHENAIVSGSVRLRSNADICGNALVGGVAVIDRDALIKEIADVLVIGPAASSGNCTTAYRKRDGTIGVTTGCFLGSIDAFEQAINMTHAEHDSYRQQYTVFLECIKRNFGV